MDDQRELWRRAYAADNAPPADASPSAFALTVAPYLPAACRLLELGCGPGIDARSFANLGHRVTATDFVPEVIAQHRRAAASTESPEFRTLDMTAPLPFATPSFDAAYARLSLHYFTDAVTRRIIGEIRRVLVSGGIFAFLCKSTSDRLCGTGEEIGQDTFRLDGKMRHFFSDAYARALLADGFEVVSIESGREAVYGQASDVVAVVAIRRAYVPHPRPPRPLRRARGSYRAIMDR